jgi:hypothetical protein
VVIFSDTYLGIIENTLILQILGQNKQNYFSSLALFFDEFSHEKNSRVLSQKNWWFQRSITGETVDLEKNFNEGMIRIHFPNQWTTPPHTQTSWHLWFENFCQDVWETVRTFEKPSGRLRNCQDVCHLHFFCSFYLKISFIRFLFNLRG